MQKHGVTKTLIHSRLREAWRGCSNGPWRHQETSREIRLGPGLISSCPDRCSSFQPRRLQPEGSLYNVYRHPHLPLQISHSPRGPGVKAHSSKLASKALPSPPTPTSPTLSPDTARGEEQAGLSPQPSPIPVRAEFQMSLKSAWPCSWAEARELRTCWVPNTFSMTGVAEPRRRDLGKSEGTRSVSSTLVLCPLPWCWLDVGGD